MSLLGGLRLQVLPEDSLPEEHADGEEAGAGGGGGADLKEVVLVQLLKSITHLKRRFFGKMKIVFTWNGAQSGSLAWGWL